MNHIQVQFALLPFLDANIFQWFGHSHAHFSLASVPQIKSNLIFPTSDALVSDRAIRYATGVNLDFHVTPINREFISTMILIIPMDDTHVA